MNKIFYFIFVLILIVCFDLAKAQESNDHLQPIGVIYDIYNEESEYYTRVRKILFKGLTDTPEIRFRIMPSFTPEVVLDIEFDNKKNKYFMVYHIGKKSIWYNTKSDDIKVKKYRAEIDKKSVEAIKTLFDVALSQTQKGLTHGCDGANYYFSINKQDFKSGRVWSPQEGSKMRKLVNIGYDLVELAKVGKRKVRLDESLKKRIEMLTNELKQK